MDMKKVAEIIKELETERGRLAPLDVVNAARDPDSPMHSWFIWDNDKAADEYRIGQARQLIRTIKIDLVVRDVQVRVVRYVRDMGDQENGYANIISVKSEADTARESLIDEMLRVEKAAKRARAVAAVLGTAEDVQNIIDLANSVRKRAGAW